MIRIRPAQLALVLAATLAGAAGAAETKVGVVNLDRLMQESPQGKAVSDALGSKFEPRQRELVAMQKELQQIEEKLNRDRAVMSDQERVDLQEQGRVKQQRYQRMVAEFEDDVNIEKNKQLGNVQRVIKRAVEAQAKEGGYDLVIGSGFTLYFSPTTDITPGVLKRLEALATTTPKAPGAPPKTAAEPAKTPPKK